MAEFPPSVIPFPKRPRPPLDRPSQGCPYQAAAESRAAMIGQLLRLLEGLEEQGPDGLRLALAGKQAHTLLGELLVLYRRALSRAREEGRP